MRDVGSSEHHELERGFGQHSFGKGSCHMRGCQNDGPFLGPLNTRCCIIFRT